MRTTINMQSGVLFKVRHNRMNMALILWNMHERCFTLTLGVGKPAECGRSWDQEWNAEHNLTADTWETLRALGLDRRALLALQTRNVAERSNLYASLYSSEVVQPTTESPILMKGEILPDPPTEITVELDALAPTEFPQGKGIDVICPNGTIRKARGKGANHAFVKAYCPDHVQRTIVGIVAFIDGAWCFRPDDNGKWSHLIQDRS